MAGAHPSQQREGWALVRKLALEHFSYYFDVVGLARCDHSSRNGRVWSSFLAYTNSKNAQRRTPKSIQTIRLKSAAKKISRNPPSVNATVRCCSGFGLVTPKAPMKLSTRKLSNLIASLEALVSPVAVKPLVAQIETGAPRLDSETWVHLFCATNVSSATGH